MTSLSFFVMANLLFSYLIQIRTDMSTLVIHPSDTTTAFLKLIYSGLDCRVINNELTEEEIRAALESSSRVIFLGHGTESGLMGWNRLVFHAGMLTDLRNNPKNIFIWCNADKFLSNHQLLGFHSGMFISDQQEARYYGLNVSDEQINFSNRLFALALQHVLVRGLKPELVCKSVKKYYRSPDCTIIRFNAERLNFSSSLQTNLQTNSIFI